MRFLDQTLPSRLARPQMNGAIGGQHDRGGIAVGRAADRRFLRWTLVQPTSLLVLLFSLTNAALASGEHASGLPAQAATWLAAAHVWHLGDWPSGNKRRPDHLWLVFHGDIPQYYRNETANDRRELDALLRQRGESAVLVYPISATKNWGGARSTTQSLSLGRAVFALYKSLAHEHDNPPWRVRTFTFSGSGRVDLALQRLAMDAAHSHREDGNDTAAIRQFFQQRLTAMNAADAMVSRSMERPNDIPNSWIQFLKTHPWVDAAFVHDTSAEYPYMFDLAADIGRAFDSTFDLRPGQQRTIADGRLRFWGAPSHRSAWVGQFSRVLLSANQ